MKFTHISTFACMLLIGIAACTPKTGEKVSPSAPSALKGAGPNIPIPTGDARKAAPKAGPAPTIQIAKAETFTLDNGLQVIVVENHKLPQVSFRVFVDNDPVLEKGSAGYVDLMGEMISKGTKTRTKSQIDEEIDYLGANLFSSASGISAACLSKHSEKVLDLMSDVLLNPTFPAEEFEKAIRRTESGLQSNKDDPNAIAGNVGARLRYGNGHPYGEFMTEESLKKVTLDQVKGHYNTYFKPNISYLVIVGDITKAKAEQAAKKYFGKWQKADVPKNNYPMPRGPEVTQVNFVNKPGAVQSVINITYPVELSLNSQDAIRARLTNTLLGGYFNSRVNANLREGHGWTYGARTSLSPDILVGSFNASASVRNVVTDSSIIEFMKEMNRLRTEKVPNSELSVVKNVLAGQFSQNLEEPGTVADFALNIARYKLPADYYEKYLSTLQSVTPEEVLQMAKKYIKPDHAQILVVGNRDQVAERLAQFGEKGKINFLDVYANPIKNINTNIPPGMTAEKVVEDYLNAIGGTAKIAQLKDVQTSLSMKTRGMEITIKQAQKDGDKLSQEMMMGGQSMGVTKLNKGKAVQSGMGGAARNIEGDELDEMLEQALPIKEATYTAKNYKLTLKGVEEIEGKSAYIIEVERPGGRKSTEYYDVTSSLKVREVSNGKGPDGSDVAIINDYTDYKEVGGVKFPHSVTTAGVFPIPMTAIISDIKVNAGIDDAMFEIK